MARKLNRRKWCWTICFGMVFLYSFYFEFLIYIINALNWESLSCPPGSRCTKLLLVADPQILGEQDEPNWITVWDSDRYLYRTFTLATRHARPDAVVFLGDLMDEGNRADDDEFQRYVDRFSTIFPVDLSTEVFFLPGDNDVGGENGDPILPDIVHRFQRNFHKITELVIHKCRIVKVNPVLESIPKPDPLEVASDQYIRIAVSHFPLLGMSTPFTQKIVKTLKPHVIFSAHSHLSRLRGTSMMAPTDLTRLGPTSILHKNQSKSSDYDNIWPPTSDVFEIEVPTCSYRMGVFNMGYGYALIDETRQELQYVVLWLPHRIFHLKIHLVSGVIGSILLLSWFMCAWRRSFPRHHVMHQA